MDALGIKFIEPAVSVFGKMSEDQAEPVYLYDEDLKKCCDLGNFIATQIPARTSKKSRELEIQEFKKQLTILQQQLEQLTKRLSTLERL